MLYRSASPEPMQNPSAAPPTRLADTAETRTHTGRRPDAYVPIRRRRLRPLQANFGACGRPLGTLSWTGSQARLGASCFPVWVFRSSITPLPPAHPPHPSIFSWRWVRAVLGAVPRMARSLCFCGSARSLQVPPALPWRSPAATMGALRARATVACGCVVLCDELLSPLQVPPPAPTARADISLNCNQEDPPKQVSLLI